MENFWQIVLVSSVTFGVILGVFVLIYYIISARNIKKSHNRMPELIAGLKPGVKVMFAGGLIGTIQSVNSNFAQIKLDKNTTVEVAIYSISNIIVQ